MLKSLTKLIFVIGFLPALLCADFKISDFRGNFLFYGATNSAIIIPGTPPFPSTSVASSTIGQVRFNSRGDGIINFFSTSVLSTATTFSPYQCPPNSTEMTATVNLLDREHGTGTIILYNFPGIPTIVFDFVASKRGCKVVKLVLNRAFGSVANPTCATPAIDELGINGTELLFLERQEG